MKRFVSDGMSIFRLTGLAVLAAMACGDPAAAADLPLKARPPAPADAGQFWVEMEYLAWSVKGDRLPPLVTTSPTGTLPAQAGILGPPSTTVLFGDSSVNGGWRSGGRLRAGYWFDPQHQSGIEASIFGLEHASTGFNANSSGAPVLARPFFDPTTGLQNAMLIAFPDLVSGAVTASEISRLYGAGALYRRNIGSYATPWGAERFSLLVGYRFLHESDRLDIASQSTALAGGGIPAGTVFASSDSFHARSNFHGVDLGVAGEFSRGPWMLEWRAKVALGANFNESQINGASTITADGVATSSPGGLLALSSNIGSYTQTRFAAVPDFAVKAGYRFAPAWQIVAGYEVLYWTGVQRAGGLIDTTVNPNLIPPAAGGGPQRPQAQFDTSSLLGQGFSVGIKHDF
jgi:putative beta barrel porin BBP7